MSLLLVHKHRKSISKARQGTAAIGDIRKAELAKDLDPTELRVSFVVCILLSRSTLPPLGSRLDRGQKAEHPSIAVLVEQCHLARMYVDGMSNA
jgi:hypothetical protein